MPRNATSSVTAGAPLGSSAPTIVLKFGSSVLPGEPHLPTAVHEIYRWVRQGHRVVAIVSALGNTTDTLIEHARRFSDAPTEATFASFVGTGELRASALLGLALDRAGVPNRVLDHAAIALTTDGPVLDSRAISVDTSRILGSLDESPVLVIPGFLGRSARGETTLLGRGGSDLTALFIAAQIGAQVRLIKDVDGLYDRDPADRGPTPAQRFDRVTWDDVLNLSEGIVQHKAVRFARDRGLEFTVARAGDDHGTVVGRGPTRASGHDLRRLRPIRVGLLGLGTVGRGVLDELRRQPERFDVTRVAVRDPQKHIASGLPAALLTTDPYEVIRGGDQGAPDVVVELIGGDEPARSLLREALDAGVHVVSGNKLALAPIVEELAALAHKRQVALRYSAAVGAALPALELAEQAARQSAATGGIRSVRGVLNGTTTYILTRIAEGLTFAEALKEAQSLGYAEADPAADVDGLDAASKLALLARAAFGRSLPLEQIRTEGIRNVARNDVVAAARAGGAIRLVATATLIDGSIEATVRPETLSGADPLAGTPRSGNALVIRDTGGHEIFAKGTGAGRFPTTESVLADLLDLSRLFNDSVLGQRSATGPAPKRAVLRQPAIA
jgi:homoserine dehydrogenase